MTLTIPFELSLAWMAGGLSGLLLLRGVWDESRHRAAHQALTRFTGHLWHCKICTAFYRGAAEERLTICPQCGSFNSQEGVSSP